jgi:hypothetical protein
LNLSLEFLSNGAILATMKTPRVLLFLFVATTLGAARAAIAAPAEAPVSRISAEFVKPESFTDFRESHFDSDKEREHLISEFNALLASLSRFVPEGQKLELRFTDIDLAGDFEPWRGPQFDQIRIMKEIYSPRMKFDFRIVDAKTGAVLRQGSEKISDMGYLMNAGRIPNSDALRYDKDMLTNWVRQAFPKASK